MLAEQTMTLGNVLDGNCYMQQQQKGQISRWTIQHKWTISTGLHIFKTICRSSLKKGDGINV